MLNLSETSRKNIFMLMLSHAAKRKKKLLSRKKNVNVNAKCMFLLKFYDLATAIGKAVFFLPQPKNH